MKAFRAAVLCATAWAAGGGPPSSAEIFTEVAGEAGITWRHFSGESEDRFVIESTGSGAGWLDYDNDGRQDLFLLTGGETPRGKPATRPRNALYRNLGNGKFEDVTERSGIGRGPGYGQGVAVADFDNDGYRDIYLSGYPSGTLYRNLGNGTFADVTLKAGLLNAGKVGAGAAWIDYDRDGLLDLFICNYIRFSFDKGPHCQFGGRAIYCAQTAFDGDSPSLFHNNGDGTFSDLSARSGISRFSGRAFGVVSIDVDGDGWQDLFVSQDASPNLLLMNQRNGTFSDEALDAEVAYTQHGAARAGMGVDAGDIDGDGRPDFVLMNFSDEGAAVFLNRVRYPFRDWSQGSGAAALAKPFVCWGTRLLDYDNDGVLDLLFVTGHLNEAIELTRRDVTYREPPMLLRNDGRGVFRNVADTAGAIFSGRFLGRGLAVADYDNDGGLDAAVTTVNGQPLLLHNNLGRRNRWLGIRLRGTSSNRDAIGARLELKAGDRKLVRWITGGGSFLSSHDPRIVFGLGTDATSTGLVLQIRWPNGREQTLTNLTPGRYQTIVEPES